MPGQVERWLETFMCKQYAETFEAYGFKTLQSLCQLQLPQLQIMGVAHEHCEQILDNVDILRQSLCGTSSMTHYQDNMYNAYTSRLPNINQMHNSSSAMQMGNRIGNMTGYNSQRYLNNQSSMMQHQSQQQQTYPGHSAVYSIGQSSPYMGYGGTAESRHYQYTPMDRRGSNNYCATLGPSGNSNGYSSRAPPQNMSNQQVPHGMMHTHMRHNPANQNPQEVANNILQMAASTYMPNQTVTIPLTKNRSAPYHIPPKSPHNNYSMQGNCPTSTQQHQQHIGQTHQFAYPNSSPQQSSQGPCASPISPNPAYMHSPASHHSGQSMPNASPQSVHSPTLVLSGPCVKSPHTVVPSPVGDVCSPCQITSPIGCQTSGPNTSPHHQQLLVNVPSGNHAMFQGQLTSPNQQTNMNDYSPKTNPVTPPASHNISPYSNSSRSSIHSPQLKNSMSVSSVSVNYFCASDIPEPPQEKPNSNPLQSLQKLCMLPDHQVIDPKSVVNDACLESPQSYDHQKNLNSDADNHHENQGQVSASNLNSPGKCDNTEDFETEIVKNCNDICSEGLKDINDLSQKLFVVSDKNEKQHQIVSTETTEISERQIYESSIDSGHSDNVSEIGCLEEEVDAQMETQCKGVDKEDEEKESNQHQEGHDHDEAQQLLEAQLTKKTQQTEVTVEVKDKENQHTSDVEEVTVSVKEISDKGVLSFPNCGLVQCKTMINSETDGCEQVICKPIGCKENDDILSEIIDYENVAKENNNEIIPQLHSDENSCIQYYRPKCIKQSKRMKKLHYKPSLKLHSQMLSRANENPLLVKTYSRRDQLAAKYRWRRSHMPRSRSLRGVPTRLASTTMNSVSYTDSDSDDGGVLLVREDIDFTQDQESPYPLDSISDEVSQEEDNSSSIDTEKDDLSLVADKSSPPLPPLIQVNGSAESVEAIDINDMALDMTKNSQTLAVGCAKTQANVNGKSDQSVKKRDRSSINKDIRKSSASSSNGHISSRQTEQKNGRTDVTCRERKPRKVKNCSPVKDVRSNDEEEENKSSAQSKSAGSRTPAKRSSRKRRRASSLKYGDLYYSADYVLDSEEEMEVEKKSKMVRKESGSNKDGMKNEEADVIILNDEEESIVEKDGAMSLPPNDPSKKAGSNVSGFIQSAEGSKRTRLKVSAKMTLDNVSIEELSSIILNKEACSENEKRQNSNISHFVDDEGDLKSLISISDEDMENEETRTSENLVKSNKMTSKIHNVKNKSKSGKGRLKKLQKSRAKFDMVDEETEEMNLRRTVNIVKKKHQKRDKVKADDSKSRVTGPFLRIRNSQPSYCRVVNQYEEDPEVSGQKITKKVSTPITVSTVHMSKLSVEKSVYVPSNSVTEDSNWVCQLCHKHSSFKFLGDLFGPYYCEENLPSTRGQDSLSLDKKSDFKKSKQRNVTDLNLGDLIQKTKKHVKSASQSRPPEEVWVHEDCIAWADGVLLIGQKIYGLKEATSVASATMCSACNEYGAMVGCLHKGCSQKYHYICALESGCYMDEENFSLLCVKHKDKKMKQLETS
ncbi:uncharacterized protein LOC133184101 [Saccostrea echinata]|uniref:uncharacterized protein LOC133184101 n=1 Tax=Saccostrea echinata TaxID=191078 RepID=UPI002A82831B|nr:uncharacterized protein LOC133184101 [Saccostrea echinata]